MIPNENYVHPISHIVSFAYPIIFLLCGRRVEMYKFNRILTLSPTYLSHCMVLFSFLCVKVLIPKPEEGKGRHFPCRALWDIYRGKYPDQTRYS